jgi:predicted transcriptional regulator
MLQKYVNILSRMTTQPLTVNEIVAMEQCVKSEVHYAVQEAKKAGMVIQKLGNTPHVHFFVDKEEVKKVKCTMQDDIRDIINAGDAWTYKELADALDLTQTQVRRAVATLIKLGEIEVNVRQIKPDKVWCTQIQSVTAEEPEFTGV